MRPNRLIDLGDVLVEAGLIARQQLGQAQRAAIHSGAPLVSVLLDMGLIEGDLLVQALQRRLQIETFDPLRTEVDGDAVREIPMEEATRSRLLPLQLLHHGNHRILRVAMADPLDRQAIEEMEFSTGCTVDPLIAHPSDLAEAIRSHYRSVVTRVVPRERDDGRRAGRSAFGGNLSQGELNTRPLRRVQQESAPGRRVDALVALLVHKGVISQEEYEDQLRALIPPDTEEHPEG
jgi:type IV pilus assembly protein PilB